MIFSLIYFSIQFTNDNSYPKQLCEDCTMELVMVAKFLEKCSASVVILDQIKQQIGESVQAPVQTSIPNPNTVNSKDADLYYENVDYCEENIEYVMYDSTTDIIEDADITDKSHETQQNDDIDSDGGGNHQRAFNCIIDEVCLLFA